MGGPISLVSSNKDAESGAAGDAGYAGGAGLLTASIGTVEVLLLLIEYVCIIVQCWFVSLSLAVALDET